MSEGILYKSVCLLRIVLVQDLGPEHGFNIGYGTYANTRRREMEDGNMALANLSFTPANSRMQAERSLNERSKDITLQFSNSPCEGDLTAGISSIFAFSRVTRKYLYISASHLHYSVF
jgi:hypothetical protein